MGFLIGTAFAALVVTIGAAKLIMLRRPGTAYRSHVVWAALSFPALAVLLFVVATMVTLGGPRVSEPGGTTGMTVFAFVFFLTYAIFMGAAVGVPTAILAVRKLRGR